MVTLTAWGNTGLNSVNLPGRAEVLNDSSIILDNLPVDLAQIYGLSALSVTCTEDVALSIDYLRLTRGTENSYYSVKGLPTMTSGNVASIPVVQDPFLTMGGARTLSVKGGHTLRSNRGNSYQGRNNLIDPYMVPKFPPKKRYVTAFTDLSDLGGSDGYYNILACTVDLTPPADFDPATLYTVDYETGEVKTSWVPEALLSSYSTTVEINLFAGYGGSQSSFSQKYTSDTAGYALYDMDAVDRTGLSEAIQGLWAMNKADAILGCYKIPKSLFQITRVPGSARISKIVMNSVAVAFGSVFQNPTALYEDYSGPDSDMVKEYANIITYSDTYKIGMLSMISGGQQIKKAYDTTGVVCVVADPRLHGKPYFIMPDQPLGSSVTNPTDPAITDYNMAQLFSQGIPGGEWESVPLAYFGASGWASQAAVTVIRDDMKTQRTEMNNRAGIYDAAGNLASAGISAYAGGVGWEMQDYDASRRAIASRKGGVGAYIDSTTPVMGTGLISGGLGLIGNSIGDQLSSMGVDDKYLEGISSNARNRAIRSQESQRELSEFLINYSYVAPTVTGIPATTWQGIIGNGVLIYVEYPDPEDVRKWAKMVQLYGTITDEYGDLPSIGAVYNDEPFTYCQTVGGVITPTAGRNRALEEDALDALAVGVRFWNILPSKWGGFFK